MKKILVTDDDPQMIELILSAFELYGPEYEILTASNGRTAMEMVRQSHPDMIILDIMMPDGHGYSVCRDIRMNPSLNRMKILVLSAKYFPRDRQEILDLGADAFIPKPFGLQQVVLEVRKLLNDATPS